MKLDGHVCRPEDFFSPRLDAPANFTSERRHGQNTMLLRCVSSGGKLGSTDWWKYPCFGVGEMKLSLFGRLTILPFLFSLLLRTDIDIKQPVGVSAKFRYFPLLTIILYKYHERRQIVFVRTYIFLFFDKYIDIFYNILNTIKRPQFCKDLSFHKLNFLMLSAEQIL